MWSSAHIPGRPSILLVDASRNLRGWEQDYCARIHNSLKRAGLQVEGDGPVRVNEDSDIYRHRKASSNCWIFFAHGTAGVPPETTLLHHWDHLNQQNQGAPLLFCGMMFDTYDAAASDLILRSKPSMATIALAQQSETTPRETGLFLLKFFVELDLHSKESITGKMAWFAFTKAKELLRRRRYTGKFGARC